MITDYSLCPDCGMPWDWCGWCGGCACECTCWATHYNGTPLFDPRYHLWNDEYGQRTRRRPVDTVEPAGSYL